MIDGRDYVLEYPIHGDVALIAAHRADDAGQPGVPQDRAQLRAGDGHRGDAPRSRRSPRSSRSATLDPEAVVTPGIFVDRVVRVEPRTCRERDDREPLTGMRPGRLAAVIARDIPPGSYVNLGIGQPTMVADHLPPRGRRRAAHRERHARHGPGGGRRRTSTPT